jgi:uncharacterized protein
MPEERSLLKFPCRFPIKVMGEAESAIENLVRETLAQHVADLTNLEVQARMSAAGNYISVTATFTAENQEQLDAIYRMLTQHEKVKYVL